MKAFGRSVLTGLILVSTPPLTALADTHIWLDVSVKLIVDPATGMPPPEMDDALLHESFADINRWLAVNWRGYRVRLVDLGADQTFRRIGALNDMDGPSKWYDVNLKQLKPARDLFEAEAQAESAYAWNNHAINIYFNQEGYSFARFPWSGFDMVGTAYPLFLTDGATISARADSYKIGGNLLHELGHFFGLKHTFSGSENGDDIADTAPDPDLDDSRNEAAVRDGLAQHNYDQTYAQLGPVEKWLVDNTANNAMSYYQLHYDDPNQSKVLTDAERFGPTRFIFTELQMDRWTDSANTTRANVASGRAYFVGGAMQSFQLGTSLAPFATVASGINSASPSGGDIVVLRPGQYAEQVVIDKPVTLRATRQGIVRIGTP